MSNWLARSWQVATELHSLGGLLDVPQGRGAGQPKRQKTGGDIWAGRRVGGSPLLMLGAGREQYQNVPKKLFQEATEFSRYQNGLVWVLG